MEAWTISSRHCTSVRESASATNSFTMLFWEKFKVRWGNYLLPERWFCLVFPWPLRKTFKRINLRWSKSSTHTSTNIDFYSRPKTNPLSATFSRRWELCNSSLGTWISIRKWSERRSPSAPASYGVSTCRRKSSESTLIFRIMSSSCRIKRAGSQLLYTAVNIAISQVSHSECN